MQSSSLLKIGINRFSLWSGLVPNVHKSEIFFSGVSHEARNLFTDFLGFYVGSSPFKYLGVPIIASRLHKADCSTLVNTFTSRVQLWTLCFLFYGPATTYQVSATLYLGLLG